MAAESHDVKVYIYDMSHGLARTMSQAFLGKQINGIWHTGIVVFGNEYFFGGDTGIESCTPGGTMLGQPTTIHDLGKTQIPFDMFMDYLHDLSQTTFKGSCYHLLDHNCNTFSSEVAQFLTGNDIPSQITSLPADVMSTPFGQMVRPFIDAMSVQPSGGHALFTDTPPSKPTSNQERSQAQYTNSTSMPAQKTAPPAQTAKVDNFEPFIFNMEIRSPSYWSSSELGLPTVVQGHFKEIYEFLSESEPTWSLGRDHMTTLCRLVLDQDKGCETCVLQLLARLVTKEDIVQLISHDPKSKFPDILDHFENFSEEIKVYVVKMLANCCSLEAGHSLLHCKYRQRTNNICVSSLLSENTEIVSSAIALSYNLSHKKLSEETELEIGSALLNCIGKDLDEQTTFNLLTSALQIMKSSEEVKGLASVLGINLDNYLTKSDRVAKLCDSLKTLM